MLWGKGTVEQAGCPSPRVPRDQQRPSVLGRQLGRVVAWAEREGSRGFQGSRIRIRHCDSPGRGRLLGEMVLWGL